MLWRLLVVGLASAGVALPAAASAPTPPSIAIFYYPWYATPKVDGVWEHWDQNGHRPPGNLYSRFYPASGPYSSSDPAVLSRQMSEISAAGIDEVIVSWWGRGSWEDIRLPSVLAAARRHHLTVALHLEPYDRRSADTVSGDQIGRASCRERV